MSQNEKKGHGGKHTRPKKWSGARRPAGPATTALLIKAFAARTHLGSIVVSQLTQRKAVHVDGGSDKNESKQGRIQDF